MYVGTCGLTIWNSSSLDVDLTQQLAGISYVALRDPARRTDLSVLNFQFVTSKKSVSFLLLFRD